MSLIGEYIDKKLTADQLVVELLKLIAEYYTLTGRYLFVYYAATEKQIPQLIIDRSDFDMFYDMLHGVKDIKDIDIFLETPGGYLEPVEEIVRFLRSRYDTINFVIAGEAKSAGTVFALSGDEIWMSETGSLGLIDAQMTFGRSRISAFDYMEWVNGKRKEAQETGRLNPFDAMMVAQITPGELVGVNNALNHSKELVVKWLPKYKFKNWNKTKSQGKMVTEEDKEQRAREIADELCNHSKWKSHGRPFKSKDLELIKLEIRRTEENEKLDKLIYNIRMVCRLLSMSGPIYKIFATKDDKIFKFATPINAQPVNTVEPQAATEVEFTIKCPKCGEIHKLYAKLVNDPNIDIEMKKKGAEPFPKDAKLKCKCGQEIDLTNIKNEIETKARRPILSD